MLNFRELFAAYVVYAVKDMTQKTRKIKDTVYQRFCAAGVEPQAERRRV